MDSQSHPAGHGVGHETTDVDIRGIFAFGVGLLIIGLVIHVAVWLLFMFFAQREARRAAPEFPMAVGQETRVPPEPRLQTNPRQDLLELRSQEDAILDSYGWVDKNAGVVRIPVDRAMQLTLERGLPARPPKDHAQPPHDQTRPASDRPR